MKNELKDLEYLISVVLNPSKLTAKNLVDNFLKECRLTAATEKDRISQQFNTVVFMPSHDNCIEMYFRQHQAALISLADKMFGYLQPKGVESIFRLSNELSVLQFYQEILLITSDLLHCIEKNFSVYFDPDLNVTKVKRWQLITDFKRTIKLIQKELRETEVPQKLITIICSPFEDFLQADKTISYRELAYLKAFQRGFYFFSARKDKMKGGEQECQLLLFMNFNSLGFFNYFTMLHKEIAQNIIALPDRIVYYYLQLKLINQHPMKPGLILNTGLPSIKDQLSNWIYDELQYYEKQQQLLKELPAELSTEAIKGDKVQTSLSVAELSLAVKLLMDTKVISHHNSTVVMRMVARSFRTERRDTISEASLRNKSYNYDSGTVDKMKEVIKGFMNMMTEY